MGVADPHRAGFSHSAAGAVQTMLRTAEMLGALVGMLLVMAAQWDPWFIVHEAGVVDQDQLILQVGPMSVIDASAGLLVPYYLGWFLVFGFCVATAYGSASVRRVCAPVGVGALAAQTLIVFSILHRRGISTYDALRLPSGVSITRASGAYLVMAALVVIGLTMIRSLLAEARVPSRQELRTGLVALRTRNDAEASELADDAGHVAYGRFTAVESSLPEHAPSVGTAAPAVGTAAPAVGTAAPAEGILPSSTTMAALQAPRKAPTDHRLYQRPAATAGDDAIARNVAMAGQETAGAAASSEVGV